MGKSLMRSSYGKGLEFSYQNGSLQGGRRGLMLAQRYPEAYDGIAAAALALHFTKLLLSIQWLQQVMNELTAYPHPCEFDALTEAAILVCDGLDGVNDGVISDVEECLASFDLFQTVSTPSNCTRSDNGNIQITSEAATIIQATWHGMMTGDRYRLHYGPYPGSDLTGNKPAPFG